MGGNVAAILCDPVTGLTPKEKAFTEEFIKTNSAAEAARKVYDCLPRNARQTGYSAMIRPDVRAEIERRVRERGLSESTVKEDLGYVVERGKQIDKLSDVVNASAWLGKVVGLFKDSSTEININLVNLSINAQPVDLVKSSLAELDALAPQLAPQVPQLSPQVPTLSQSDPKKEPC